MNVRGWALVWMLAFMLPTFSLAQEDAAGGEDAVTEDAGEDAAMGVDSAVVEDAAPIEDAWTDDATVVDAAVPVDSAAPDIVVVEDAAVPEDSAVPDAGSDDAVVADVVMPDGNIPVDAAPRPDRWTAPDLYRPDGWRPDIVTYPDFGGLDLAQPDSYKDDAGPCVTQCVDDFVLHSCTATGDLVVLNCPTGHICRDAQCSPEKKDEDDTGGCNCSSQGLGSGLLLGLLGIVVVLPWWRRRSQ